MKTSLSIYSEIVELRKKSGLKEDVSSLSSLSGCWDDSPDGQAALSLFYLAQMISRRGQKGDRELSATFLYRTLEMRLEQLLREMNAHNAIEWTSCVLGMAQYHRSKDNKIRALSLIESGEKMLRRCTSLSDWKETERFRDVRVELSRLRSMLYLDTMRAAVRDDDEDHQATTVPDTKLIPKAFPMCEDTTSSSSLRLLDPSYVRDNLPDSMRASFRIVRSGLENALDSLSVGRTRVGERGNLEGLMPGVRRVFEPLSQKHNSRTTQPLEHNRYSYVALGESEENLSMRIKIRRRMTKILEPILESLNRDVYLETCIVLAFELAEACVSLQMMKNAVETNKQCETFDCRARACAQDVARLFCELVEKEGRGEINEDRVVSTQAKLHGAYDNENEFGFQRHQGETTVVREA